MTVANPYDEFPYKSLPIEWTAPERLALASLLHGGPRQPLIEYRVLELGCGDGSNLLPLAYYRRNGAFVGVDGAGSQIEIANSRKMALELSNVDFIHADFSTAGFHIAGQFDYILAHGVFSWVSVETRDALLKLCAERLRSGGLLYLNYNTRPGWNVRGMVREFLLAQTAGVSGLRIRAELAQEVASKIVLSLNMSEHPYTKLISNEFQFVCENHTSFVAHEYLAIENHAYWRSDFMALCRRYGFEYLADADFNYNSGRIPDNLAVRLEEEAITGRSPEDTMDLLIYRQLHTPILTRSPLNRRAPTLEELSNLLVASCLVPCGLNEAGNSIFQHPSGFQVEAKDDVIRTALEELHPLWPRSLRIGALFPDVNSAMEDLMLLQKNGLIEMRCIDPIEFGVHRDRLIAVESQYASYATTPNHTREAI